MDRINLFILDGDSEYLKSLEDYFITFDHTKFKVKTFTNFILMENLIKESGFIPDIILLNEKFYNKKLNAMDYLKIILVEENSSKKFDNLSCIAKYSTGHDISRFLLEILSQKVHLSFDTINPHTKIITITSPEGGSGKSLISISISKYLSVISKKVLYIPLKHFSSLALYFNIDNSNSISKAFYYIKDNNNLGIKLNSLAKKDTPTGIYYYSPAINPYEITDLTSKEFNILFSTLKNNTDFDYIIFDIQSGVFKETDAFINNADILLTTINTNLTSSLKLKNYIKLFNISENSSSKFFSKRLLIFNKSENNTTPTNFDKNDLAYFTDYFYIKKVNNDFDISNYFQLIYKEIEFNIGEIVEKLLGYGEI